MIKEISVQELKSLIDNNEGYQLIDVRELFEYNKGNLRGLHIPMSEITGRLNEIDKQKKVIIYCRSGSRSLRTVAYLQQQHNFNNLYNLKGGVISWKKEIEPDFPL